ncbi:MAG: hypothetical protein Q8L68_02360, partial [Methylococcales bacterium]|nr:hypothetical protein [Methylococcales bacterium]
KHPSLIKLYCFRFGLICSVTFLLPSCDTKPLDSKVRISQVHEKIFWIDDDRILTVAGNGKSCQHPSHGMQPQTQILEFNTRNNDVSWYGSPRVGKMCYSNGNIGYMKGEFKDGLCVDGYTDFYGTYGQEEKIKYLDSSYSNTFDDFNCTLQPRENAHNNYNALPRKLVEGHGWILGSEPGLIYKENSPQIQRYEHPTYPIAIYPELDGPPIYIDTSEFKPWIGQGYQVFVLRYEKFKNAYLLGLHGPNPLKPHETPSGHGQFWWLYPDGRLETIIKFEWQRDDFLNTVGLDLIPTKAGVFLVGGIGDPGLRYKNGLYKQTPEGDFKIIVQGEIKKFALSPNGCKLAFARNAHITDNYDEFYLQAIDLCKLDGIH